MSQSIFQVRPQDAGKGWAIDEDFDPAVPAPEAAL